MLRKFFFPVLYSCFLFFSACTKDVGKLPAMPPTGSGSPCDNVTYTKDIKPIIENNCLNCHGATPSSGAPILMSYAQVKDNASKIKATVFDSQPELMPQGGSPLPKEQKDLINCWLNNGKKE